MWRFLEQQSFPLNESDYCENLAYVIEVINRLGKAAEVRAWLSTVEGEPKIGRALSLPLRVEEMLGEFVI